jgi:hypothetical protein
MAVVAETRRRHAFGDDREAMEMIVSNQTARSLIIEGRNGATLRLAPFERRAMRAEELSPYDLRRVGEYVELDPRRQTGFTGLLIVFGLGFWLVPLYALLGAFLGSRGYWLTGATVIGCAFALGLAVDLARRAKDKGRFGMAARGAQLLMFVIVVGIGAGVPAAVVYFLADVDDVVRELANAAAGQDVDAQVFALAARTLQLVFIATLTLLPALLFFVFDRVHLSTLRDDFVRHIIRFDPELESKRDVMAKYGPRMEEAYGTEGTSSRLLPARRSPLLLATLVIALGWTLTLLNPDLTVREGSSADLVSLFEPERSAVTFGFLGAYFYALGTIFRGYVRKDLLPKAYTHITVRIFLTIVLAWVLDLVTQGADVALVLAFVAGILPETAIRVVQNYLRSVLQRRVELGALTDRHPLTNLDEIDIYDHARLLEEGVNNVEALAHHDVIDLMLQTRIPVPRLVDWVDQAILYLHVGGYGDGKDGERRRALDSLGMYGIRTATDLEGAVDAARKRGPHDGHGHEPDPTESLMLILPGSEGAPPRIRVILDVIDDEEWMHNLRYWRSFAASASTSQGDDPSSRDAGLLQPSEALRLSAPSAAVDNADSDVGQTLRESPAS